jgi:hypothetical protein
LDLGKPRTLVSIGEKEVVLEWMVGDDANGTNKATGLSRGAGRARWVLDR